MNPALLSGIVSGASSLVNLGLGIWQNKKNEDLMRESWHREDTAVSRRVMDLKKAGLNPVLAAGQGAQSSGPVQVSAPEVRNDAVERYLAVKGAQTNIAQTKAQTAYINSQTAKNNQLINYLADMNPMKLRGESQQNLLREIELAFKPEKMQADIDRIIQQNEESKDRMSTAEKQRAILDQVNKLKSVEVEIQEKFGFDEAQMENLRKRLEYNFNQMYGEATNKLKVTKIDMEMDKLYFLNQMLEQTKNFHMKAGSQDQLQLLMNLLGSLSGQAGQMQSFLK